MARAHNVRLEVDYNQVAVFSSGLANPFNDWEERHVGQGFSWRPESVSFRTLENGPHLIEVVITEHADALSPGVIRAVEVPFEVPHNGRIDIASISESAEFRLSPGKYLLRSEMFGCIDGVAFARLVFARSEIPRFSILVADKETSRDGPLLKEAEPAR
ncbi:competence protein ComJ [Sinorhizobium meliloti]|uniref:competence protein ComJ n=1 Tax=Rhizobium meliloti TaxID=382 RepID=UPI003F17D94E